MLEARTPNPRRVIVLALLGSACVAGCRSSEPRTDWDGAQNLQFSEDARDPTERDKEGGWYRFRPREEPDGTDSPLSPDRRRGYGGTKNP